MDLDGASGVIGVIALLLHWRIFLCFVAGAGAAFVAVQFIPWLSGLQGIVFALFGFAFGVVWDDRATNRPAVVVVPDQKMTDAVACAYAGIAGATWGIFSSTSVQSLAAGLVIVAAGAWWWVWHAGAHRQWAGKRRARLCVLMAAIAYPLGALVGRHAL